MKCLMWISALSIAALSHVCTNAATLTTLYTFSGGADGGNPGAALVPGQRGSFFGTTVNGGAYGNGTVFQLMAPADGSDSYSLNSLYSFAGGTDGAGPTNLISDTAGNLYGVSNVGGAGTAAACTYNGTQVGCGTVFELQPPAVGEHAWHEVVLHAFSGNDDGFAPSGLAIFDGKLYGFTWGGSGSCNGGCGTVYELTPPGAGKDEWNYKRLHSFSGHAAANGPFGNPLIERSGSIYGIAYTGGPTAPAGCAPFGGCGEVFKLAPPAFGVTDWTKSTVWAFDGLNGTGGFNSLSIDSEGNIYGMTNEGGNSAANCPPPAGAPAGCGVAFKLEPSHFGNDQWTQQILWNFSGDADSGYPADSALAMQRSGNLIATTSGTNNAGLGQYGAIAQLVRPEAHETAWKERTLFTFANDANGAVPVGAVVAHKGSWYGTTYGYSGVAAAGTVYRITP
jgi:uncharacterized repeat protein (TIGR03803 family)